MNYQRRFAGIEKLYGAAALTAFSTAHIAVFGVGGVGSWAVEALARSGVGHLTLVDMDHVTESNINRQLPALESTLGKSKIQVMADRVGDINAQAQVHLVDDFLSMDNLHELVHSGLDVVLDCIDNFRLKAALAAHCKRNKIKLVVAGAAGGKLDPTRIRHSDLSRTEQDPLLAKTRRELRTTYNFTSNLKRRFDIPAVWSDEPPVTREVCEQADSSLNCAGFGSSMPVTATFGLVASSLALKIVASRVDRV